MSRFTRPTLPAGFRPAMNAAARNASEASLSTGGATTRDGKRLYIYNLSGTANAGQQVNTPPVRINSAGSFVVDAIVGAAWLTTTTALGVAFTPLADASDPSPPATIGNTVPSTAGLLVQLQNTSIPWAASDTPWPNIIGTGRFPVIPRLAPAFAGGTDFTMTLRNQHAVAVGFTVSLWGHFE